ncbi:hypothetical protein MBM_00304 [Drepanopeziza brunnea f. sp. 'multigermtubi' MB_m1]|uniref:Uncharacterized protein n=1 Tax=Marssonina brunnea f. sp. multigermtubi (strain MB_m1) TaxID=1072389 RepID=K1X842_MARBU|nr:uncharacterized protein MBM_00304 [Drepanopeziza brunnea f. sp. 'multigermtubi' MB_m1]EKD21191.1 hypothetical protein MBM_00304 [Drepanopeziza brunnea f. sp. 'multigermtubi' MB_m1]
MSRARKIPAAVAKSKLAKMWRDTWADKSFRYMTIATIGFLNALALMVALYPRTSGPWPRGRVLDGTEYQNYVPEGYAEHGHVIAIELGESYSRVAVPTETGCHILVSEYGGSTTANYVAYYKERVLVGREAQEHALHDPENVIFDARRLIGRRFSTDSSLQSDIDTLPYRVINKYDRPYISIHVDGGEKLVTPEQAQAEVIKTLKRSAEQYVGYEITSTIVTVPAYFKDDQRQATKDAVGLGGLEAIRVINEPTAAAIGYELDQKEPKSPDYEELSVVYDVGEKSLDVTVISVDQGVFEILASAGDRSLGGAAYDRVLFDAIVEKFSVGNGGSLKRAIEIIDGLKARVRYAEGVLATNASAEIQVGDFSVVVTPDDLKGLYKEIFEISVTHIDKVLQEAKLNTTSIKSIILKGDPTHVAKVQPFLEAYFEDKRVEPAPGGFNPDEAIIRGAAQQARVLSGIGGSGPMLGNFEITVLSLGIETSNGLFTRIIPRSHMTPIRRTINVTTFQDGQSQIRLRILQGERLMAINNRELGVLEMGALPEKPAGEVTIEVAFEYDANDILTVIAKEFQDKRERRIFIDDLGKPEYRVADKAVFEAEEHTEEDLARVKKALAAEKTGEMDMVSFGVISLAPVQGWQVPLPDEEDRSW